VVGCSRILVTGGAGFIGSHLVDRLVGEGFEVVVLDSLQRGRLENIKSHVGKRNFRFVKGDIRDFRLVNKLARNVDGVLHQAALVNIPQSIDNPTLVNEVNVDGTLGLLKACVDCGVKRFVYASSCAVYGEAENLPIREDSTLTPLSPYGVSKLAAESYVRVFCDVFGLETVCLRYFNVYGPRQANNDYSGVITQFMNRLVCGSSLRVFGDGEQTRDFVHVQDVVEANVLALSEQVAGEIFNIGTGFATTINRLANLVLEITKNTHLKLVHEEPRKGDIKHSVADISKAKKRLHYNPRVKLKEGLDELVKSRCY
jgi:UDP-glucose 4-epimerase